MGALVGGLYAAGYTSSEIESAVKAVDWNSIFSLSQEQMPFTGETQRLNLTFDGSGLGLGAGLINDNNITQLLSCLVWKSPVFAILPTHYYATGTNADTGELHIFNSGPLYQAMRASMSIPVGFYPVAINGSWYIDGGMLNNNPTDVAIALGADVVLDMDVRKFTVRSPDKLTGILDIVDQTLSLVHRTQDINNPYSGNENYRLNMHYNQPMGTAFSQAESLIRAGEEAARSEQSLNYLKGLSAQIAAAKAASTSTEQSSRPESYASLPDPVFEAVRLVSLDSNGQEEAEHADISQAYLDELFNEFFGKATPLSSLERAIEQLRIHGEYRSIGYYWETDASGKNALVLNGLRSTEKKNSITLGGSFGSNLGAESAFYSNTALDMKFGKLFYDNSSLQMGVSHFLADVHGLSAYLNLDFGIGKIGFFELEASGGRYWPGISSFHTLNSAFSSYEKVDAEARVGLEPLPGLNFYLDYRFSPRWYDRKDSLLHTTGFSLALDSSLMSGSPHAVKVDTSVSFPIAGSRFDASPPWFERLDADAKYVWKISTDRDLALDMRLGSYRGIPPLDWAFRFEGYDLAGSEGIPGYPLFQNLFSNMFISGFRYRENFKPLSRALGIRSFISLTARGGIGWHDLSDTPRFEDLKGGLRLALEWGSLSVGMEVNFEGRPAFSIYYGSL
jgi:predicted acylesterase/phospholipase RssA